tara:strand:- start:443 stop:625 length:183 start_codon:yes stop_codon:yes gene_type:complete
MPRLAFRKQIVVVRSLFSGKKIWHNRSQFAATAASIIRWPLAGLANAEMGCRGAGPFGRD